MGVYMHLFVKSGVSAKSGNRSGAYDDIETIRPLINRPEELRFPPHPRRDNIPLSPLDFSRRRASWLRRLRLPPPCRPHRP